MTEVVVGNGIALRKSSVIKIFVLRPGLASVCNRDPVPLTVRASQCDCPTHRHIQLADNTAGSKGDLSYPDIR